MPHDFDWAVYERNEVIGNPPSRESPCTRDSRILLCHPDGGYYLPSSHLDEENYRFPQLMPDPNWPVLESDLLRVSVLWVWTNGVEKAKIKETKRSKNHYTRHVLARAIIQDKTHILIEEDWDKQHKIYGRAVTLDFRVFPEGEPGLMAQAEGIPSACALTIYKMGLGKIW